MLIFLFCVVLHDFVCLGGGGKDQTYWGGGLGKVRDVLCHGHHVGVVILKRSRPRRTRRDQNLHSRPLVRAPKVNVRRAPRSSVVKPVMHESGLLTESFTVTRAM